MAASVGAEVLTYSGLSPSLKAISKQRKLGNLQEHIWNLLIKNGYSFTLPRACMETQYSRSGDVIAAREKNCCKDLDQIFLLWTLRW